MTHRLVLLMLAATLAIAAHGADTADRERTLKRLARVAELYRDHALGFACQETITYTGVQAGRIQFAYLFVRDENGRLHDFRTWRMGTTAKDRGQAVHPADYHVPLFLESAYLWAFVFRSDRQPFFDFDLRGTEIALGRSAVKIEFVPRGPIREGINDWAGYAWIDRKTTQILEVEAYTPADWNLKQRRDAEVALAPTRDSGTDHSTYEIGRIVTKFGFEKNGMRFPSHVELTKALYRVYPGPVHEALSESTLQRVVQDYSHFEFFSVRTREEIVRFVDGYGPLVAPPPDGP